MDNYNLLQLPRLGQCRYFDAVPLSHETDGCCKTAKSILAVQ